jgi:hypothetical protein
VKGARDSRGGAGLRWLVDATLGLSPGDDAGSSDGGGSQREVASNAMRLSSEQAKNG